MAGMWLLEPSKVKKERKTAIGQIVHWRLWGEWEELKSLTSTSDAKLELSYFLSKTELREHLRLTLFNTDFHFCVSRSRNWGTNRENRYEAMAEAADAIREYTQVKSLWKWYM